MEFKSQLKRVLPLILLVDTSGSMNNCMDELNSSVKDMLKILKEQESLKVEIQLSFITFGDGGANLHTPLTSVLNLNFEEFRCGGMTPLGGALKIAKDMIEDREVVPSNSYRPTVIMLSDGGPNDNWEQPFIDFVEEGRTKKCERLSLGIGTGYIHEILSKFSSNGKVFEANDASNIVDFFKFVTMTMKEKSKSENPNKSTIDVSEFFKLLNQDGDKIVKDKEANTEDTFQFNSENIKQKGYFNL